MPGSPSLIEQAPPAVAVDVVAERVAIYVVAVLTGPAPLCEKRWHVHTSDDANREQVREAFALVPDTARFDHMISHAADPLNCERPGVESIFIGG